MDSSQSMVMALFPICGLVFAVVCFCCMWYSQSRSRSKLPPGPFSWPIVGNLPEVARRPNDLYLYAGELMKTYGEITSLYFGGQLVVFLNSYEVIREATIQKADKFSNRPQTMRIWQELYKRDGHSSVRMNASRNILKIAFGHPSLSLSRLENIIGDEIQFSLNEITKTCGEPFDPTILSQRIFSASFYKILFGNSYDYNDPIFKRLDKKLYDYMSHLRVELTENFLPALKYFKRESNVDCMRQTILGIDEILDGLLSDHKTNHNLHEVNDVLSIMVECEVNKSHEDYTSDSIIKHAVTNLLLAALESSQVVLRWVLLYLIRYPHIMRQCQSEIDRVVGFHRRPTTHDRQNMPYTQALILETLRHANIAPLGAPRSTTDDTFLKEHFIPKETIVFLNIYAVHMDERHWEKPKQFNPDRWLGINGILKKERFIPFSLGPKYCPGGQFAKLELFLAITNILQRFDLASPAAEDMPSEIGIQSMSLVPKPYKISAKLRSSTPNLSSTAKYCSFQNSNEQKGTPSFETSKYFSSRDLALVNIATVNNISCKTRIMHKTPLRSEADLGIIDE